MNYSLTPAGTAAIKAAAAAHKANLDALRIKHSKPRLLTGTVLALALIAFSGAAAAGDFSVIAHGASHHFSERAHGAAWNEKNVGLGLRYAFDADLSVQTGIYRNSEFKNSAYLLSDYTPLHIGPVSIGGFAGVASGYAARAVQPVAGAVARVTYQRVSLAVRAAPKSGVGGSAVVSAELAISF